MASKYAKTGKKKGYKPTGRPPGRPRKTPVPEGGMNDRVDGVAATATTTSTATAVLDEPFNPDTLPSSPEPVPDVAQILDRLTAPPSIPTEKSTAPAPTSLPPIHLHRPSRTALGYGGREIKMMYPTCNKEKMDALGLNPALACQDPSNIVPGWWMGCEKLGHRPYWTAVRRVERRPLLEDIEGDQKQRITGYEETTFLDWIPNITQIGLTLRQNSGQGPQMYRVVGYILPTEHHSLHNGARVHHPFVEFCMYRDCFSADTQIITREGVRALGDLAGSQVEVLTEKGWKVAPISSFGEQEVQDITFAPAARFGLNNTWGIGTSKMRKVERATARHRWVLTSGEVTQELKVGDYVRAQVVEDVVEDEEAFIHGFVFGDGSIEYQLKGRRGVTEGRYRYNENGDFRNVVTLYGKKSQHLDLLLSNGWTRLADDKRHNAPRLVKQSPVNMKTLPADPSPGYATEFLRGWLAADGNHRNNGTWILASSHLGAEEWLSRHAAMAGWLFVGRSLYANETNLGTRKTPCYGYILTCDERAWKVVSIEPAGRESTFCATVPEVEAFTLASGIYTGNCWSQDITIRHKRFGNFCNEEQARMIGADDLGKRLECMTHDEAIQKRQSQLDSIPI